VTATSLLHINGKDIYIYIYMKLVHNDTSLANNKALLWCEGNV
jgi:hypothetical protein